MAKVIDCTSPPSISSLKSAGVTGLIRYLTWEHYWGGVTHTGYNPKLIRPDEYNNLVDNGFDVVLNWEFDAADWLSGASGGTAHAAEAVRQAQALGYPAGRAIYGSCDIDMTASQWNSSGFAYVRAFSAEIRAGGYLPGVYGPYDVLSWCQNAGLMDYFWQAAMSTSWSGGRNSGDWPDAHLYQARQEYIGGIQCDVNDVNQDDYGQVGRMNNYGYSDPAFGDNLAWRGDAWAHMSPTVQGGPVAGEEHLGVQAVAQIAKDVEALKAKVDAISTAIASLGKSGITDAQVAELAAALTAKLPPELTEADVATAMRTVLHNAFQQ
ncbi:MAG TPA: DUF1906 domain-containing protein [Candidatus Paceibacterota bacterium]